MCLSIIYMEYGVNSRRLLPDHAKQYESQITHTTVYRLH